MFNLWGSDIENFNRYIVWGQTSRNFHEERGCLSESFICFVIFYIIEIEKPCSLHRKTLLIIDL